MIYFTICLVALLGSCLTLFSGFGLGTILVPVFAIFFPVELAIALTAIVHFLNNVFKLVLLGKHASKEVVLKFGLPSLMASFLGAYILTLMSQSEPLFEYSLGNHSFYVHPLKLTVGALLIFFALFDIIPKLANLEVPTRYLFFGGLLSGFFGGLSGNQGALRSAFLIRANLPKEVFIATGVVIACLVDISRLTIYSGRIFRPAVEIDYALVALATLSAFIGAFFGNKLVKKITVKAIQIIVAAMLIVFGILLCAGIL